MKSKILYEDEEILVIHKPAGLATQSANVGRPDVVSELKGYLAKKAKAPSAQGAPYLGIVHRLDQPVEGLLAFAKTKRAAAALTKQLMAGALNKTYYAAVLGAPKDAEGELMDDLLKDGSVARVVTGRRKEFPEAKEARLRYRLLETATLKEGDRDVALSLLEVQIETGRFHQIRAQLSHAGMPIYGDAKYGEGNGRNVALCAKGLECIHPLSKKRMKWEIRPEGKVFAAFSALKE